MVEALAGLKRFDPARQAIAHAFDWEWQVTDAKP
jgi:hypothetical protein